MVNELNRPQNGENAALSERLAASNRQLQEMQEEHRELLQEMETLRMRAAELTLLNAQRHQQRQSVRMVAEESSQVVTTSQVEAIAEGEPQPSSSSVDTSTGETAQEVQEEDEDKEETASYLQEKLNEIAQLKAQFKRVQHMVDTTKLIEEHMSSRQTTQISSSSTSSRQSTSSEVRVAAETQESESTESPGSSQSPPADNAELLNSMLNMFTDFTSDLRGQAETLREERDRIKALKEEIIQRKQGK